MEGRFFFHLLHESMVDRKLYLLLHEKLKVWWNKNLKKLFKQACTFIREVRSSSVIWPVCAKEIAISKLSKAWPAESIGN